MNLYCEREDIEMIFGEQNVVLFAQMGSEDTEYTIELRIDYFIALASADFDSRARALNFQIPLIAEDTGETPLIIKHMTARQAGIWLYEALGLDNFSSGEGRPDNKYWYHRRDIEEFWNDVANGKRLIDALKG